MNEENGIYSDYYERYFSLSDVEDALERYAEWCKKDGRNMEPEVTTLEECENSTSCLDHVLYHAEMNGFVIEDGGSQALSM